MDKFGKHKLTPRKQIEHLKTRGVKFTIIDEVSAKKFLTESNFYFKLKSYCKNYSVDTNSNNYKNLEFAYLVELSTIDMHLRRFLIRITLDIEHALKVKLLNDFSLSSDDGYKIIDSFLLDESGKHANGYINKQITEIKKNGTHSPSSNIINKYGLDLAIWNFVEVVQFGHLVEFCKYFYTKFPNKDFSNIKNELFNVKCLRNSTAHNNCLLSNLNPCSQKYQNSSYQYLITYKNDIFGKSMNYSNQQIKSFMENEVINDFITSLIVFDKLCKSKNLKHHAFRELYELFQKRFKKNSSFFEDNELLKNVFLFLFKIIKFYYKRNKI